MRVEVETAYVEDLLEDLQHLTEGISGDSTLFKTTIDMISEYLEDQKDNAKIKEAEINQQLELQYEEHLKYLEMAGISYPYKSHRASKMLNWDDIPF